MSLFQTDQNGELPNADKRYFTAAFGTILSGRRRVIVNSIPYHDEDHLVLYYRVDDIDDISRFLGRVHHPLFRGYGILEWCDGSGTVVKRVDEFGGLHVDGYDLVDGFSWTGRRDTMFLETHWLCDRLFQYPNSAAGLWQLKWQGTKNKNVDVNRVRILRKIRETSYVSRFPKQIDELRSSATLNPCFEIPLTEFA